jgi:hypothetical protein
MKFPYIKDIKKELIYDLARHTSVLLYKAYGKYTILRVLIDKY